MKKTVLFLFLSLVMVGCKQGNDDPENNAVLTNQTDKMLDDDNCIDLTDYNAIANTDDRAAWLRTNGERVCKPILYSHAMKEHTLQPGMLGRLTGSNPALLTMSWKQIKAKINGHFYDKYIGFKDTLNGQLTMELIPVFTVKRTCYSVPLFLSIADSLQLKDDDIKTVFAFSKTTTKDSTVVFKVSNALKNIEMNYSTKPLSQKDKVSEI